MKLTITTPFKHRDAAQRDEADAGGDRKRDVAQPERENAAGERERHAAEDEQRILHAAEGHEEQNENEQQRERNDDLQPSGRGLKLLKLPTPRDPVAAVPASLRSRIFCCASATNEPMSRPRMLQVTTTRRLPFSRLI